MPEPAPRILFVPVSGAFGMGEYARSLAIARAAAARWPGARIHFVLSGEAPYALTTPFPTTLLKSSPTFHSVEVIELIRTFRPDLVIFDNAGRTRQLRAARRVGARVIFISARARQRRRAFRFRWMGLLAEHWIAYPEFIAGSLNVIERLKLTIMRRPVVRYLDVILSRSAGLGSIDVITRAGAIAGTYVLVVPGGGTGHPGANHAIERFQQSARELAEYGTPTVFIGPESPQNRAELLQNRAEPLQNRAEPLPLHCLPAVPQADLAVLMRGARLVISNGGSTLLQAISCGCPCIAVPIARDQVERIRRCVTAGVAVAGTLDAAAIAKIAGALLRDETARSALAQSAKALALGDGVERALAAMAGLLATPR